MELGSAPAAIVRRDIRCERSGPRIATRAGPADGVAGTAFAHERVDIGGGFGRNRRRCRLQCVIPPSLEGASIIRDNFKGHVSMLPAAILGALAAVDARPARR